MRWCRFIQFFIFFGFIGFTKGHQDQRHCNSSCGGLQIRYPFRLKEDPTNCGDPSLELTCSGNRTFMKLLSTQFLIKDINYTDKFIKVIEIGLLRSNCSLPFKSVGPSSVERSVKFVFLEYRYSRPKRILFFGESLQLVFISLMNCSKKITLPDYQLISCLSQKDSYVYGVSSPFVSRLAHSCSFLFMMPTTESSLDLFQAIRNGFSLSWFRSVSIKQCLRESWSFERRNSPSYVQALFDVVSDFLYCLFSSIGWKDKLFKTILWFAFIAIIMIFQLVLVVLLLGRFVIAPLTLCIFIAHQFWTNRSSENAVEKFLQTQQSLSPTRYLYTDIIAITGHFKEQLGRGGFGSVYKGELPGKHFVAVKVLAGGSKCQGDDFISEVSTIGRIHHHNIVRLVGFCSEGSKRALVYEFMPNKSLDKFIFSSNRPLSWQKLNSIALGIARGIDYLHRGCDMMILHFDIKPQNILLDRSFVPKVSDFGLAKLYPKEHNVVSVSAMRGTIGYIAPELVSRSFGLVSHKSDVYSFGMLLMEMVAGRRNNDVNAGSSNQNYFPSLIYDKLKLDYGVEEGIKMESFEMNEVEKKMCLVGLWCIQIRSCDRPSMRQVVDMIEGDVEALQFPPKPCFSNSTSISRTLHSSDTATTGLTIIEEDDGM